jgi:hypothetical protein
VPSRGARGVTAYPFGSATVIILGIILIVLGLLLAFPILYWVGGLLLVIGLVLTLLGSTGHPVYGHRTYW